MTNKQVPERPFQQIAADFASYGGKQFLVLVDCKTDWPDIIAMGRDTTTTKLAATLRDHLCRTAAPDLLWSDGGPQFTSRELADMVCGPCNVRPPHTTPKATAKQKLR